MIVSLIKKYMEGPGGRLSNNKRPQGLTMATFKHHVYLQPLFVICGMSVFLIAGYGLRSILVNPAANWAKVEVPEETIASRQYKFLDLTGTDCEKLCQQRPKAPDYEIVKKNHKQPNQDYDTSDTYDEIPKVLLYNTSIPE